MTEPLTAAVALQDLATFDFERLGEDAHNRIDVTTDRWVLPFLVVPKRNAARLLVMQNGAIDHSKVKDVVFQRSSWSHLIEHHQVYLFDPTTATPDRLPLGWGQGSRDTWIYDDALTAVRHISDGLGIAGAPERVHFGSSAGGFMALTFMALDEGSTAIVNNAQFDWTRWMPMGLNPLREALFDNMLPLDLRTLYPTRTSVLNLFEVKGQPLSFQYCVNIASKHDREIDYPMLHDFIMSNPQLCEDIRVMVYSDPQHGHNPLPQSRTLELLNSSL